jgi:glyoxylase-like metal-dependent hydrolase (beta-lactamase superfamily II)/8-oxo-dGTP pyrophosphatase MutT (NUDIX family)
MSVTFRETAQGGLDEFVLAAAVVLTRGRGEALELYCVHRSPELRAFPDLWALPGGRVDAGDGDARGGDLDAFRTCALRELFEETGVAGPGIAGAFESLEERARVRRALTAEELGPVDDGDGAAAWRAVLARSADPLAGLEPVCWTTTPRLARRRFRALYVHLECPAGEEPLIVEGELVDGRFARPADLLAEWRRGELGAVPPLAFLLEAFERAGGDLAAALREADARAAAVDAGGLHAVYQVPGIEIAPLLTPTLPPAVTTNCAIAGNERLWVVDPATYDSDERRRLIEHLERRARTAELAGVVVTHHHRDHVGSVAAVARRFGLAVHAHPLTLERLPEPVDDPRPLHEGDTLALGTAPDGTPDWRLEVLHTPGHDRGHLALRDTRYRTVIAGDLVSTLSTIVIDPPEGHLATYLGTLQRVRDEEPGALIPAHGGTAHDGRRLLEGYLRHRARREAKLVAALERLGPVAEGPLAEAVYDDVPAEMLPLAVRSLRAGLEKLAEEGRAGVDDEGRWRAG